MEILLIVLFIQLIPLAIMFVFRAITGTIKNAKWVGLVLLIAACWGGGVFTPWMITDMIIGLAVLIVAYRYSRYYRIDLAVTTLSCLCTALLFIIVIGDLKSDSLQSFSLNIITYITMIIGTAVLFAYQIKRNHVKWEDDGDVLLSEEKQRIVAAAIYGLIAALLFEGLLQSIFSFLDSSKLIYLPGYAAGAAVAYLYIGFDKKYLTAEAE